MKYLVISLITLTLAFSSCETPKTDSSTEGNDPVSGAGSSETPTVKNSIAPTNNNKSDSTKPGLKIDSIYTDLAEDKCVDAEKNESEGWSTQSCKGVAGYSLLVSEGDLRQTIDVITPEKKKFELEYWTVVSSGFSTVGDKAEWRVKKENGRTIPIALIVRYNVNENAEDSEKITSYLTVSKITAETACVTDIVKPIKNANQKARSLADKAQEKACIKKTL